MSAEVQANPILEQKPSDKELNFRKQQQMYERMLAEKEAEIAEIKKRSHPVNQDDDSDDEPYVDKKKLVRELSKFGEKSKQETKSEIQNAVSMALAEERRVNWLKTNSDFSEVMQHAQKFAEMDPELAETILSMPDTFERQKLVYKNIKALGIHKPPQPQSTIQDKIDNNKRGAFYQPTGVGSAPYASQGDFSEVGQKSAYDKMMELKRRLGGR